MRHGNRRWAALLLATMLIGALIPLAGPAGAAGTFTDDDGNIHESAIESIAAQGITKGCNPPTNDLYCPDDLVTRQQMASFLVRAFDLPAASGGQFTDIAGSVHANDINALAASGITKGCNPPANTRYCPTDLVTRGQMAAFIARGLELDPSNADKFSDDDNSVFETQIDAIARIGITKGCNPPTNDKYCPDNPVRRDEMASFLSRVAAIINTGTTTTTKATTTSTSTSSTTTTLPSAGRDLFKSADADRQPATTLEGSVVSGNAYIFAGPDEGVNQTRFYLDDPARSGAPYRVEDVSSFDLEGTAANGNANPFDTFKLKNGSHSVSAEMVLSAGGTDVHSANFTVSNPASVWLASTGSSFNLPPGGSSGSAKSIQVNSNNGNPIAWTASESAPWLTLTKSSGTGGQSVSFNASAAGLTPGVRTTTVTVSAPGYLPRSFKVTMNVLASGSCPSPAGTDVTVALPFNLEFTAASGSVTDADGQGTGFNCVQATSNGEGYLASNLNIDTAGGTLSISTTDGLAFESVDSQDNTLGVGFNGSGTTVITTTLLSPPWEANGGFEQAGVWVGIHEDTFVKAVLLDAPGGNAIQLQAESLGDVKGTLQTTLTGAAPSSIGLQLTIDQATLTASLAYSRDGSGWVALPGTVPVSTGVFAGTDPDGSGPAGINTLAGIFASHRNGTAKTYTFGNFTLGKN